MRGADACIAQINSKPGSIASGFSSTDEDEEDYFGGGESESRSSGSSSAEDDDVVVKAEETGQCHGMEAESEEVKEDASGMERRSGSIPRRTRRRRAMMIVRRR